jgi:amino acid transporter
MASGGREHTTGGQPRGARAAGRGRGLRRDIGTVGLLFTSVGSIIGSGWLFGSLNASLVAGPAAVIAWVLGGAIMILLALIHAELASAYPVAGGSARFPLYAFGGLVGFASGWFAFIGAVTTAPIEVEAALQYASNYVSGLYRTSGTTVILTPEGYAVAGVLMLIFSIINMLGVQWLAETNKVTVWWKIAVPLVTVVALVWTSVHTSNFTDSAAGGFMPFGWKGVFLAIASGGIIFSYLGFEQAIQLGGESKNPGRNLPLAVIGSMLIGVVLYIALQLAFTSAVEPNELKHGWTHIVFAGKSALYGPFAGLATVLGLGWLATLLYTDAIISPGGTALLYVGTSSRLSYALGRGGYVPRPFARLSGRDVPVVAIVFSFACGMIVFLPFPGWQQLVGFITSATVLSYAMVPVSLGALRRQDADRPRPFRLPFAEVLSPLGFVAAGEVLLFSGWAVVWKLVVAILIGVVLLAASVATTPPGERPALDWRPAMWLPPYLVGMSVISYLSSFSTQEPSSIPLIGLHGPRNDLSFGWDVLATALFSAVIYAFAIRVRLPAAEARAYVEHAADDAPDG